MSGTAHASDPGGAIADPDGEPPLAVVVIGMSAGSLYALRTIVRALPKNFPGALVIAHHVAPPSILPELIRRWTNHHCEFASTGATLRSGSIYVAPAQHHVIINPDATLGVSQCARRLFSRPSVNWLFESAAASFENRAIAIVLSGANDDGAEGVTCIEQAGGTVIVQDPDTCDHVAMPGSAIITGVAHRRLHPCEIAPAVMAELSRMHRESPAGWYPFGAELAAPIAADLAIVGSVSSAAV
jgi:two-component system chemotaxis response regulator CheB